ncbi:MAG: ROK family protein [Firmicutes bacterium]|nr:ROK family protein [Bacillota bacterium]
MVHVISIDLGGSYLKAALVDESARIIRRLTLPTSQEGRSGIIQQLAAAVSELKYGYDVGAVGVGTPGFVDSRAGKVLRATNLPGWTGTNVKAELSRLIDLPIVVENDANLAALGEAWVGAGKELDNFVMLTLGTGVGGAIYSRDTGVWRGATYRGGELGHSILYPGGEPCACGQRGCVEQYLSGQALERRYSDLTGSKANCEAIFQAALAGKELAESLVQQFSHDFAVLLASLKNMLDPEAFVIGGGLVHLREAWWFHVKEAFYRECMQSEGTRVLPAATGNNAGLLGAAALAWDLVRGQLHESYC